MEEFTGQAPTPWPIVIEPQVDQREDASLSATKKEEGDHSLTPQTLDNVNIRSELSLGSLQVKDLRTIPETVNGEINFEVSGNGIKVENELGNSDNLADDVSYTDTNSDSLESTELSQKARNWPEHYDIPGTADNSDMSLNPMTAGHRSVYNYPMPWPSQEQDLSYAASVNHPQCIDGLPNYNLTQPCVVTEPTDLQQKEKASCEAK